MNARCVELKKIIDAKREEITIVEPDESKRVRLGLMEPPAGAYNQFFTSHFFCDGEIRGLGMSLNTIYHCLRDKAFTMEHIATLANCMLPFSGEYLHYAGLHSIWDYLKEFIELCNTLEDKEDLVELCASLIVYDNYLHAWTHLMAPWGTGGQMYNFQPKELRESVDKYFMSEADLKKHYPLDRGQKKFS